MRIAYVVNQFPALSETFVAREVVAMRERGLEVEVFTFTLPSDADRAKMSEQMTELAQEVTVIAPSMPSLADLPRLASGVLANARAGAGHKSSAAGRLGRAFALAKHLRAGHFDQIHAHWPIATMVTHVASILTGLPYSVSIHAHEVAHENGHFAEAYTRLKWASYCNGAAMEYLLGELPESARTSSHLVYHGVETERFSPLAMPETTEPFRVVSAGRLTPTKGFDRLVRACSIARARGLEVELAILGRGAEEEVIRATADEVGFADKLDLPGWVSHDVVADYLGRSHVFALPASTGFHDGLPNVVLEAMASGRPAILSPLPAAQEAIASGVEGVLLESELDVEGLAQTFLDLAADPQRLAAMGTAARARVVRDHDAGRMADRLRDLHLQTTSPTFAA